ncbi:MAG: hypothetical protein R2699_05435 [Acidimicrobiales bacterium]
MAHHPVAGDVGRDGLDWTTTAGPPWRAATSSSTRPPRSASTAVLLGPSRIAATLHDLGASPHLVAVSTCYVAGNRRGAASEIHVADSPFFVDVDWRSEVDGARRFRSDAEAQSRNPERCRVPGSRARTELGAAGTPLLADKTEQLRGRWVSDSSKPDAPAASLGWPDAYAFAQGARRAGLARVPRRSARVDRATVDHRVRPRRATAGLDPRLPHGRAGDHLLRPRAAQGVPPASPRDHRRHPRRSGDRRHHRRSPAAC